MMHDRILRMAAVFVTLGLGLAGCAASGTTNAGAPAEDPPAQIAEIPGKDVKSVTLSGHAHQRLGVATTPVAAAAPGTSVPYAAVFYTPDGDAWVFTATKPLTYVREKVTVTNVGGAKGDTAFLSAGPAAGTEIVTIGAIELYGAEIGVSEE